MTDEPSLSVYETSAQVLMQGHGPVPVAECATRVLASIYGSLSHDYSSDVGVPRRERESALARMDGHDE